MMRQKGQEDLIDRPSLFAQTSFLPYRRFLQGAPNLRPRLPLAWEQNCGGSGDGLKRSSMRRGCLAR
jgi:hypothetical protein